ncbi:MAG: hypothetical protein E7557_00975 [Ruminococcaceae bacterium]|nr:hypothetical protein [Oscillospiraceae bacterium]
METIKKDNFVFCVDIEKTREYYVSNTLCDCYGCRNLYEQIKTLSEKLSYFLSEFGIDICRPDESSYVEIDNYVDYLFIGYTVTGWIETEGIYETDIEDFHIKISKGDTPYDWFPNEQKEPCFFVSVEGISLPWVLNEPFPDAVRFIDRVKAFFNKK